MDCSLPGSSAHGILQTRILEWLPFPASGYLPNHGFEPRSPELCTDSLDKSTRVGCHAFLQRIFPTQGWNPGLLHCRQILYQLSFQCSGEYNMHTYLFSVNLDLHYHFSWNIETFPPYWSLFLHLFLLWLSCALNIHTLKSLWRTLKFSFSHYSSQKNDFPKMSTL